MVPSPSETFSGGTGSWPVMFTLSPNRQAHCMEGNAEARERR